MEGIRSSCIVVGFPGGNRLPDLPQRCWPAMAPLMQPWGVILNGVEENGVRSRAHGDDASRGGSAFRRHLALVGLGGIQPPWHPRGADVWRPLRREGHGPGGAHPERCLEIEPGVERVCRGQAATDVAGTHKQNGWHRVHQLAKHEITAEKQTSLPSLAQVVRRGSTASACKLHRKILGTIYGILTARAANTIMVLHAIMVQSIVSRRRIALLHLLYQR